ncbi:MAG TPA: ABC transporter ATP-binding protein [Ramlibacter sp.]|nr:ABC transporter ATP-binding protein [Ramlibacter sp.]
MATPPLLRLENVTRSFGALRAVDGVSFAVGRGGITGLIGPNGAGKTTLFNTIAGALAPDAGRILLDGHDIAGLRADQVFHRGIGRTFQIPRPLPALTVMENLLLAPTDQAGERFWAAWVQRGAIRRQEAGHREKAREILEFTGLTKLQDQPASVLSGGQQKLLELARILMVDPALILLDEPAAGVNPVLLETLLERIQALNRGGVTFLLIEHNMDVVMRLCNPVVVMAQGQLVMQGTPEDVRRDQRVVDAYLGGAL